MRPAVTRQDRSVKKASYWQREGKSHSPEGRLAAKVISWPAQPLDYAALMNAASIAMTDTNDIVMAAVSGRVHLEFLCRVRDAADLISETVPLNDLHHAPAARNSSLLT